MEQQILVIHGGDTFENYGAYLENLKSKETSLERFRNKSWKDNLQKDLGNQYEVIMPRMPNPQNARYEEWKIWFEKILPLLKDELILLGHSLGGSFIVKYLSENLISKKIKGIFLVGAPFDEESDPHLKEFVRFKNIKQFLESSEKIIIYHSKDDLVVPFNELLKYKNVLPKAEIKIFEDRGHFNQESFPEIIESIFGLG